MPCHATNQDSHDDICNRCVRSGLCPTHAHGRQMPETKTRLCVRRIATWQGSHWPFKNWQNVLAVPRMSVEIQRSILQMAPVTDARCMPVADARCAPVVVGTAILATKWAQTESHKTAKKGASLRGISKGQPRFRS